MWGRGIPFDVMGATFNGSEEGWELKDRAVPFRREWRRGNSHASGTVPGGHIKWGSVIEEFKDSRGGGCGRWGLVGLHHGEDATDLGKGGRKGGIGHVAEGSAARCTFST